MKTVSISKTSLLLLRISIGIVFVWFGLLKFFPGYSPAEDLAANTINKLTIDFISSPLNKILLAILEVGIGLFLIIGIWRKPVLILLLGHMICTFTPLFFFPELSFKTAPFVFTLVGQYIMKNIIIICAALVLWQDE